MGEDQSLQRPALVHVTQRVADEETHMECRFADGQKFAAVVVLDIIPPHVTDQIYEVLRRHIEKTE